jgi:hypothetical protein
MRACLILATPPPVGFDACVGRYTATTEYPAAACYSSNAALRSGGAWCPLTPENKASPDYLQIDLGSAQVVTSVSTQGRADAGQWVTSYSVSFYLDGYTLVQDPTVYDGNRDQNTIVTNNLETGVRARYIRLTPLKYHNWPSMRACVGTADKFTLSPEPTFSDDGLTNKGTYSATSEIAGTNSIAAKAQINGPGGWSSLSTNKANDFLQIDLGSSQQITAIFTQGRKDVAWWTTSYHLFVSQDGVHLTQVGGLWEGNQDQNTIVGHGLADWNIQARYVRIYPLGFHGSTALRAGVRTAAPLSPPTPVALKETCPGTYSASSSYPAPVCKPAGALTTSAQTAWCASSPGTLKDYLTIDLGQSKSIAGLVSRGRNSADQYVTSYYLFVSSDNTNWTPVGGLWAGNQDVNSTVISSFDQGVSGRYVRVQPSAFHGWTSLRACVILA